MADTTILIKTFERPDSLRRLLRSIRENGCGYPVFVADDSRESSREMFQAEFPNLVTEYVELPFDVGISAGRNAILELVRTPYFLLCDDDHVFDDRTDLAHMRRLLDASGLDLLAGARYDMAPFSLRDAASSAIKLDWQRVLTVLGVEIPRRTFGNYQRHDSERWKVVDVVYTPPVVRCEFVGNFFLAKTARVRETVVGWDPALKVAEHQTFFLKARETGLKVGHTEEVGVRHFRELPPGYTRYRWRTRLIGRQRTLAPSIGQRFRVTLSTLGRTVRHYRAGRRPPRQ